MPRKKLRETRRHCTCRICRNSRLVKSVMSNGSHQQKNRLIYNLMDNLGHTEDDLNYYQCIMAGTWPSAVEQLEKALEKAKEIKLAESMSTTVQ